MLPKPGTPTWSNSGVASSHPDQEDPDGDDEAAVQAAEKARQQISGVDLGGGVWELFFPEESRERERERERAITMETIPVWSPWA